MWNALLRISLEVSGNRSRSHALSYGIYRLDGIVTNGGQRLFNPAPTIIVSHGCDELVSSECNAIYIASANGIIRSAGCQVYISGLLKIFERIEYLCLVIIGKMFRNLSKPNRHGFNFSIAI